MNMRRRLVLVSGALLLGVIAGLIIFGSGAKPAEVAITTSETSGSSAEAVNTTSQTNGPPAVETHASYEGLTRDDMMARADAIFIGRVTSITPARWNQDSGEFWEERAGSGVALPYHQVTIEVMKRLVDSIGLQQQVTLTIIGGSPAGSIQSGIYSIANKPDHSLQVQQEAIFFVKKGQLAWHGSTGSIEMRPTITLMGFPALSYLKVQDNGLYRSEDPEEHPLSVADLLARIKTAGRTVIDK